MEDPERMMVTVGFLESHREWKVDDVQPSSVAR
jgi:hypothetical protein